MASRVDDERKRPVTACFTGHRQLDENELPVLVVRLDAVLEAMWKRGFRRFISGGALGFDTLAAERVAVLRQRHPDTELILVLPHSNQSHGWSDKDCQRYVRLLALADDIRVLSQDYYQGCMLVRNRYMVDRSSYCLCLMEHTKGGTVSTVAYASRSGVPLLNLAMADSCAAFVAENISGA